METVRFKFIASQARSIYHCKKFKIKVLKCNADIYLRSSQITQISKSLTRHQPHKRPKPKPKSLGLLMAE